MENLNYPQLNHLLFGDTDLTSLDYNNKSNFIIKRVFEYGTWEDILEITIFYGDLKIKKALLNSKSLTNKTVGVASLLLNIPKQQFKAFRS